MSRTKAESVHRQGVLTAPTETTDAGYIGLRETIAGAVERARMFDRHVQNDTHCTLEVEFSPHGIAFFTMHCQGPDRQFQSTLFKKTFKDKTRDWGTWHFWGDLPLSMIDSLGNPFITARWKEMP